VNLVVYSWWRHWGEASSGRGRQHPGENDYDLHKTTMVVQNQRGCTEEAGEIISTVLKSYKCVTGAST
jgi:hypothetical protein